jgi:uncharacterized protein YycO
VSYLAGDVLLLRSKSFLSWVIRKLTRGHYSHCAVFTSPDTLVEATFDGVYCSPLSKFLDDKTLTIEVRRVEGLTQEEADRIVSFVREQCGCDYDLLQVIGLFFTTIFHTSKIMLFNVDGEWLCSELVSVAFFSAGVNLFDLSKVNIYNITPTDLEHSSLLVKV